MHTYDAPRRLPYTSSIPAMRPTPDTTGSHSATPIYDSLYAEFRRSFKALPGDRSGEEELGFTPFGTSPHSTGLHSTAQHTSASYGTRYGAAQHGTGQMALHGHTAHTTAAAWQPVARQHATGLVPALPPSPRKER